MKDKLKSRKLWVTVIGTALGMLYPPAIPLLKLLIPSYVVAQGVADAFGGLSTKKG